MFTIILLASAAIALFLWNSRRTGRGLAFNYGIADVTDFLRHNGIDIENVDTVRRDPLGKTLFLFLFQEPGYHNLMIAVSSNNVRAVNYPGRRAFPLVEGGFAAWFDGDGTTVHFKGGQSLSLPKFSLFDVDPSGEYFVIGEKPTTTWIGRVSSPEQRVVISTNVLGDCVFANGTNICICGGSYQLRPNGTYLSSAVCLVVTDDGGHFRVQEQHVFEWASGIVDVDPSMKQLLLWDKWDWFNSVYVYNLETKKRQRIGFAKNFQFFLRDDLLMGRKIHERR